VLASLNHPNIAQVYGVEDRALVMELVEGDMLNGPLPLETALNYAKQIAEALEAAHEKGIVHRDLKPANVKITPQGLVKVLDFGLAAVAQPSANHPGDPSVSPTMTISPTRAGMILGTAAYMSPEQAHGKSADRRADIWSFGAVLYEMLTGKRAFNGESVAETLASVLKLEPDWSALPDSTPAAIRRLVQRCLTRDRQQRLQAIGEARITIEEVLSGKVLEDSLSAPIAPPPRLGKGAWVVTGLFAVAAVVGFWAPWRSQPADKPSFTFNINPSDGESFYGGLAVSPDGRQVAATVQDSSGRRYLRVYHLDSLASRSLPGTEGALTASWSPDSHSLAFAAGAKLKRIDVDGGAPQNLCDIPNDGPPFTAWSRDGLILFSRRDGLWRVSAVGGTPLQVTLSDPRARSRSISLPSLSAMADTSFIRLQIGNRDAADSSVARSTGRLPRTGT
jgi:serine/threonine-protein kinase